MYSDQQFHGVRRRTKSSYKIVSRNAFTHHECLKQQLFLPKTLLNLLKVKLKLGFNALKGKTLNSSKTTQKLTLMIKGVKKYQQRIFFTSLRDCHSQKIKKICGLKLFSRMWSQLSIKRKYQAYNDLQRNLTLQKTKTYLLGIQMNFVEKLVRQKINQSKEKAFASIKTYSRNNFILINFLEKSLTKLEIKVKMNAFMKVNDHHFHQKSSNFDLEPPTIESQDNIKYIEGLQEQQQEKLLKKSTSQSTIRMRDSTEQNDSRKSGVSCFVEEEFTQILAESVSTRDYKKEDHKTLALTYKRQLDILKSQLEVMKQINENYQKQMEQILLSRESKQVRKLENKVQLLQKQKQKYKQRSKNLTQQIAQMKEQFKYRIENLQMRLKKQF